MLEGVILVLDLKIRAMKKEDLEAVLQIERASFSSPWTRDMFLSDFQSESTDLQVAVASPQETEIVGYSVFWFGSEAVHITNLAAHLQFRRRKVAQALLVNLLEEAKSRKAKRALLEVRVSNIGAQELYMKFGFRQTSVQKSYYRNSGEDALVMCKNLEVAK